MNNTKLDKPKIAKIFHLLDDSPQVRSVLPCDIKNFKKMVLYMEPELMDKLYATLLLESQL